MVKDFKQNTTNAIREKRDFRLERAALDRKEKREKPEIVDHLIEKLNGELKSFGVTAYKNSWYRKIWALRKILPYPWRYLRIITVFEMDIILRDYEYRIDWGIAVVDWPVMLYLFKSTKYGDSSGGWCNQEKLFALLSTWISDLRSWRAP